MKDLDIGKRIRVIRQSYGMTQAEFAAEIGKSAGYVSLLEKGNIYNEEVLSDICKSYSVDAGWLHTGIGVIPEINKSSRKDDNEIGTRIGQIRKKTGMTQIQFAEFLSCSVSLVENIEEGRRKPTQKFLSQVSEKLNIPITYLIFGEELPNRWVPPTEALDDDMQVIISYMLTHKRMREKLSKQIRGNYIRDDGMTLGGSIRQNRLKMGLSQKKLGEKAGCSMQMISDYENDVFIPNDDVLKRILQELHIEGEWEKP